VLSEGRRGPLGEPDITSLAALGGLEDVPAAGLGERAPDLQGCSFEVQIFPFEALQFAATEPGGNSHDVEGFQPILSRRLEESMDLFAVQRPYLFSGGRGGFTGAAALRGIRPSSVACLSALLRVRWMCKTVCRARPPSSFSR
jgi:hypothetical protein